MSTHVVVVSAAELDRLVRAAVRDELAARDQRGSQPDHVTVAEAAASLRCSVRTVHRYLSAKRLTGKRVAGGKVLVQQASLDRLAGR